MMTDDASVSLALMSLASLRHRLSSRGGSRNLLGGGGQTKVPNQKLKAKPESRVRSARVSRAKLESRARSARELRAKPEPRAKPEKKRGEGSGGGGSVSPLPRKFLKNQT